MSLKNLLNTTTKPQPNHKDPLFSALDTLVNEEVKITALLNKATNAKLRETDTESAGTMEQIVTAYSAQLDRITQAKRHIETAIGCYDQTTVAIEQCERFLANKEAKAAKPNE